MNPEVTIETAAQNAEQILTDLQTKRQALVDRQFSLAQERQAIAFDALAAGDANAQKKLAAINKEAASSAAELESYDAAIAQAAARLQTAEQREAAAADRADAIEARKIWAEIEHQLQAADKASAEATDRVNEAYERLKQLHLLGVAHPNTQQFCVYGGFVAASYQMKTPSAREGRFLAPNERRDWKALVDAWGKVVMNQLAARIGGPELKEGAA
jgi:hypothetical protein